MSLLGGPASSPRAPLQSSKARMKKLPKKSQNEKYRLKYLRLRKAAKATVFVSLTVARRFSASTLLIRDILPRTVPLPEWQEQQCSLLQYTLLLVSLVSLDKFGSFCTLPFPDPWEPTSFRSCEDLVRTVRCLAPRRGAHQFQPLSFLLQNSWKGV